MTRIGFHLLALLIGAFIFTADFTSKYLVQHYIPKMSDSFPIYPYGGIPIFRDFLGIEFSIVHETNRGAAWGVFAEWQHYLLYFRILLLVGLLIYLFLYNKKRSWEIPLTLIIAGAFGNIVDYFYYHHVVDMFYFVFWNYRYPVFNVADSAIFIGIVWLFLLSWIEEHKSPQSVVKKMK